MGKEKTSRKAKQRQGKIPIQFNDTISTFHAVKKKEKKRSRPKAVRFEALNGNIMKSRRRIIHHCDKNIPVCQDAGSLPSKKKRF